MRSIAEVSSQELVWSQPARLKRAFELRAGDDVVATLGFQRGTLADAEAANQRWTFKRQGFWHPRVAVTQHAYGPKARGVLEGTSVKRGVAAGRSPR